MEALARDIPVLGTGWGMHAINVALSGGTPVPVEGHGSGAGAGGADRGVPVRRQVFLSPGAKVSSTIGGSGWVNNVPCAHTYGIHEAQKAPGLLGSAYGHDGVIEAAERPGRHWVIGVEWRLHLPDELPRRFDNLLLAFVERTRGG
jgi:gamma-glutamyl-gamma-aminobutyrate hydrolase PuuD